MSILTHRPRRLRKQKFNRSLVRENSLSSSDLIYPLFVIEGENKREKIESMPGIERELALINSSLRQKKLLIYRFKQ